MGPDRDASGAAAGLGLGWNVGVFAAVAVLGALACALVPRLPNATSPRDAQGAAAGAVS